MLNLRSSRLAAPLLALILAACATPPPPPVQVQRGVIEQISATQIADTHQAGVGAVMGGLVGVGLGSLIGAGTGRDVAMVAGAIGGAMVGNDAQKKHDAPIPAQQIIVRTNSGVLVAVTQPLGAPLRVGQKVYIQGSGEGARVTPE